MDDYFEANRDQGYEIARDSYINSISDYLATQNIAQANYSIDAIEQQMADLEIYGFDHLLNQAYSQGKITYNTKQLLNSYYYYHQSEEIDAATFNEIAIIFENSIVEAGVLSNTEEKQTLSFISVVKYDNAIENNALAKKGEGYCRGRGLGGFIIGFLSGGLFTGFVAGSIMYLACLFL